MRLLVTGDRNWTDKATIRAALGAVISRPPVVLIHGAARGADRIAAKVGGEEFGFSILPFPAKWSQHGRAAGPIRNQLMLDGGQPDLCFAFHDNLGQSKGTKDMVERCRKAGVPVRIWRSKEA